MFTFPYFTLSIDETIVTDGDIFPKAALKCADALVRDAIHRVPAYRELHETASDGKKTTATPYEKVYFCSFRILGQSV